MAKSLGTRLDETQRELELVRAQLKDSVPLVEVRKNYVPIAEYNRVQALLRGTQQFCAKYKREARGADKPISDRRAAMEAAKRLAMETGTTVTV